jgi:hypothetical protein
VSLLMIMSTGITFTSLSGLLKGHKVFNCILIQTMPSFWVHDEASNISILERLSRVDVL